MVKIMMVDCIQNILTQSQVMHIEQVPVSLRATRDPVSSLRMVWV